MLFASTSGPTAVVSGERIGRDGGGRGAQSGTVRESMSIRRIKACLLTAACIGLVGVTGPSAFAFGGRLFGGHKGDCGNPCDTGCGTPCATAPGAGGAGAPCAPTATQKITVNEYVPTWVEE